MTKAYRHTGTGVVIAVEDDSTLEEIVTKAGTYEAASLEDLATDVPAFGDGAGAVSEREDHGGWLTPAGVKPEAITAQSFGGAVLPPTDPPAADEQDTGDELVDLDEATLAKVYEVNTVEGVNGYLDDNPELAKAVLAYEADHQARTGIVNGRHKAADDATATAE